MRDALAEELASRRARLGEAAPVLPLIDHPALNELGQNSRRLGETLQQVFAALGLFKQLHSQLSDASARLFDMAETLHFESLNAKIAAGKLDQGAAVLGAVSRELSDASQDTESLITRFRDATEPVTDLIGELILDTGAARLEAEICEMFAAELSTTHDAQHDDLQARALHTLLEELGARGAAVDRRLNELYHRIEAINSLAIKIVARVNELKAVQFAGTKEALSRREAAGFIHIFKTVGQRVADGKRDCAQLLETIQQCRRRGRDFARSGPEMRSLLEAIEQYPGLRAAAASRLAAWA
jgi:hypothetical protein